MEFLAELHPMLVHFPIACFFLYVLFEAAGYFLKKNWMNDAAFIILGLGIVTALFAMLTGNQAETFAGQRHGFYEIHKDTISGLIKEHENWATITMFWFLGILLFRFRALIDSLRKKPVTEKSRKILLVSTFLGLIGLFFVVQTGSIGGRLVYIHGVGVTPYRTSAPSEKVVD